jgi:hypothetical protein
MQMGFNSAFKGLTKTNQLSGDLLENQKSLSHSINSLPVMETEGLSSL